MAVGATRHGWKWKALAWRERKTVREAERVAWLSRREAEGTDMVGDVAVEVLLDGRWLMTIGGKMFGQWKASYEAMMMVDGSTGTGGARFKLSFAEKEHPALLPGIVRHNISHCCCCRRWD